MTTDAPSETSPLRPLSSRSNVARRWARICCGAAAGAFVLMEIAGGVWPVVLLTPYSPQWAAIGLIGVGLMLLTLLRESHRPVEQPAGSTKPSAAVNVALLAAGALAAGYGGAVTLGLVPWRTIPPLAVVAPGDRDLGRLKLFAANVHTSNTDRRTVLEVIAEEDPDLVLLTEVSDSWIADLEPLNRMYRMRRSAPDGSGNFGISVWSKLPAIDAGFTLIKDEEPDTLLDAPQFDATLSFTGRDGTSWPIRFVGLHPMTPMKPDKTAARDTVLSRVARSVVAGGVPTIVAGDFNATRYCRVMRQFTALRDAASPLRFSWPNTWSWWAMGIRIDHVLATDAWRVVDVHAGRDIHSDHLPIVATLQCVDRGDTRPTSIPAE